MDDHNAFLHLLASIPPISSGGERRLERLLGDVVVGYDVDLRTPLYSAIPREEIVESLEREVGFTGNDELDEIEFHEKEKSLGSLSIRLPWAERVDSLDDFDHQDWNPDESALKQALMDFKAQLPVTELRPWTYERAFEVMTKGRNSGLPEVTSDKSVLGSYLDRARTLQSWEDVWWFLPFWRGQSAGLDLPPKQRLVWGDEKSDVINGLTTMHPILNALRSTSGFSAYTSDELVDVKITELLQRAHGRPILSSDFEKFDARAPRPLIESIMLDVYGGLFSAEGFRRLKISTDVMTQRGIVTPYTIRETKTGGIPSGVAHTSVCGSGINKVTGLYVACRTNQSLLVSECLGDDSVFLYSDGIDSETFAKYAKEIGLIVNPNKVFLSTKSCHYLQRWHSLDYTIDGLARGVHSPYRTVNGMMNYEYYPDESKGWNEWMDRVRWITQAENDRHHPHFNAFVRWLMEGDPKDYLRLVDPKRIFGRAGGVDVIRSTLNITPFPFNVRDPSGMESFRTVKILRKLN